jgi:hypothetical protein
MPPPPYFAIDLVAHDLLPRDWTEQVHAASTAPERIVVATPLTPSAGYKLSAA